MSSSFARFVALGFALVSSGAAAQGLPWPRIALERVASGFTNPVHITHANDGSARLFVVEQRGRVRILKDGAILPAPFLDISSRVSFGSERGLLSIAFPPGRGKKSEFYADYTDVRGDTAISRFTVSGDPNVADATSEEILLSIPQPFANHNGGQLAFGPDGYLYVGMGDGGDAGDPNNNAQNPSSLLGKILRIDVVGKAAYAVPPSNPFVGTANARGEIWAYGLRNPWRFSFDRKTNVLYIADVGQGAWEEVDVQPAESTGGENYGWRLTEGNHCFAPSTGCPTAGITSPVAEYSHAGGNCSVTGGFVYRGRDFDGLTGIYFYGDYCSGRIWGLRRTDTGWDDIELLKPGFAISTFGEDEAGEIYVADYTGGVIHRLTDADGKSAVRLVPVVVRRRGPNRRAIRFGAHAGKPRHDGRFGRPDVHRRDVADELGKRHGDGDGAPGTPARLRRRLRIPSRKEPPGPGRRPGRYSSPRLQRDLLRRRRLRVGADAGRAAPGPRGPRVSRPLFP